MTNLTAVWVIAGSIERFQRVHDRLLQLGVQPPAEWVHHVPCCIPGCKRLAPGEQSLSQTHSSLWRRAWETGVGRAAIFEDDVETTHSSVDLCQGFQKQLLLFGHCEKYKCLHAYAIDAHAGRQLWLAWNASLNLPPYYCTNTDIVASNFCLMNRRFANNTLRPAGLRGCTQFKGHPGGGLFGEGIFGQNRSMANYLHARKGKGKRVNANSTILNEPVTYTYKKTKKLRLSGSRPIAGRRLRSTRRSRLGKEQSQKPCEHAFQCPQACVARQSKSQWGEDKVLMTALLELQPHGGTFVELGALDGISLSNTFALERCMNWTGLLIEGNRVNFEVLQRSGRARSSYAHSAVCRGGRGTVTMTHGGGATAGQMGVLGANHFKLWHKMGVNAKHTDAVPCDTLQSLMEQNLHSSHATLLSLDVEGAEDEVLASMGSALGDAFKMVLVEWGSDAVANTRVHERLANAGYRLWRTLKLGITAWGGRSRVYLGSTAAAARGWTMGEELNMTGKRVLSSSPDGSCGCAPGREAARVLR